MYPYASPLLTVGSGSGTAPYGFVAAGSGVSITGSGNINVPYPASIQAGQTLLLFVNASQATGNETVTTPSGWTLIGSANNGAGTAFAYWTTATGSESGNLAVSHGAPGASNDHFSGIMAAYSGCDATAPIVDPHTATGSSNPMTYASVALSAANQIKIDFGMGNANSSTIGTPTGFTSRASFSGGVTRTAMNVSEKVFTASGATGTESGSQSSSSFYSTIAFGLLAA